MQKDRSYKFEVEEGITQGNYILKKKANSDWG